MALARVLGSIWEMRGLPGRSGERKAKIGGVGAWDLWGPVRGGEGRAIDWSDWALDAGSLISKLVLLGLD
jgi:hypothetical protein